MIEAYLIVAANLLVFDESKVNGDRTISVEVVRVIDGDTFAVEVPDLPKPLNSISIRIRGIDTPESFRPKCYKEKLKGNAAKQFLSHTINHQVVLLKNYDWDKYGGRIVADVFYDGRNVGQMLLNSGLAVRYSGKGTKKDWCGGNQ